MLSIFEGAEETLALKVVARGLMERALAPRRRGLEMARQQGILGGLRVVEAAACGRAAGRHDAGADGRRRDPHRRPGRRLDYRRWPVTADNTILFWCGLNKSKRSVALDLASPEGREIAMALACAPGEDAGLFLTNFRRAAG